MKIEDRRTNRENLTFDELYIGDTFETGDDDEDREIWVKCGDEVALNLNDDYVEDFGGWTAVRKINVRIVIED